MQSGLQRVAIFYIMGPVGESEGRTRALRTRASRKWGSNTWRSAWLSCILFWKSYSANIAIGQLRTKTNHWKVLNCETFPFPLYMPLLTFMLYCPIRLVYKTQVQRKGFTSTKNMCVSCSVVSDSLWPHGLQPARLLCPWDSPGKNTRMGCHFLLQDY